MSVSSPSPSPSVAVSAASASSPTAAAAPTAGGGLAPALVGLLATGAGLGAATLYFSQPLLGLMASSLGSTPTAVGAVPTLTQLGYALGILLLAPLGDRWDRRLLIGGKAVGLALALAWCALAPGVHALWAAALVAGVLATLAQDIVPAAATLAPDAQRGRVVGQVMTGLLLGILLSRVFSGLLGQWAGWRAVYGVGALLVLAIGLVCARGLPRMAPVTSLGYGALLASLGSLWRTHGELRRAVWTQGLLSIAFSAFWSTLAIVLQQRFGLGSAVAGAFGLAGVVGALGAPWAGRWSDRYGPLRVVRWGAAIVAGSFALLAGGELLPAAWQLALMVAVTVAFDFGVQVALVGHQTLVYRLEPAARSRLNALLLTGMFIGMALGSALGSQALAHGGWLGVAGLCALASASAWGLRRRG
ncbi:MAG: MFS transporter [Acidovorax sp.]|uniref:MFS transporter n=1 Tax=Acidovorax sp. TaxID=1872122 RepID=UPI0025C503FA|nr:MFS transporter [Acidovorax sp.]MCE1193438.1 MFS transporter [Acidovorax sp.]